MKFKGPFIVALSGDPVAGKSSAIRELMKRYEAKGYSEDTGNGKVIVKFGAGALFREVASKAGIKVDELTELAKNPANTLEILRNLPNADKEFFDNFGVKALKKSIDIFVDDYMIRSVRKAVINFRDYEDAIIIADSRIAGLLLKQEREHVFNVRFSVRPDIAAKRLMLDTVNRKNEVTVTEDLEESLNRALESLKHRAIEDRRRFIQIYSENFRSRRANLKVDLQNLDNYDLVIDTSGVTIFEVVNVLMNAIESVRKRKKLTKEWKSTKYLYVSMDKKGVEGNSEIKKICALKVDGEYFALEGQEEINSVNSKGREVEEKTGTEEGYKLFPVEVVAENDELFFYENKQGLVVGTTAREYMEGNYL